MNNVTVNHEEDANIVGKVHSVTVENFVTYDRASFYPGDYLNIIIGPNGTGKSTLVAAIVLGMGGSPEILSRSSDVQDYVKNGKTEAFIEVSLYKNNCKDLILLSRKFNKSNKSIYKVDDHVVNHKQYLNKVKDFNVQINNLCQFLPQDRVQDFAKMNPREILANTQISVCSTEIVKSFENLKEWRDIQKNEQKILSDNMKKLKETEARLEILKVQVENMKARKKQVKKLEILKMKLEWSEFEKLYLKVQEIETDLKKAKENHKNHENNLKPLLEQFKSISSLKSAINNKINEERTEAETNLNNLKKLQDKTEELEDSLNKAKGDLQFLITSVKERDDTLRDAVLIQEICITDLENAKAAIGSPGDIDKRIETFNNKSLSLKANIQELLRKRQICTQRLDEELQPQINVIDRKIAVLENVNHAKLEWLRINHDHAYQAVMWLRSNKHLLSGVVYEPMVIELNVTDSKYAKYFENLISIRDLTAFTCERKEDMNFLMKKFRNELNLNVNLLHSSAADSVLYNPKIPLQNIRQYGCKAYLLDLINGPYPILNFLCRINRIHLVPIGNDDTYAMAEEIPASISLFFSTNHRFEKIISQYSGEISSSSFEIYGKGILGVTVNQEILTEQKHLRAELIKKTDRHKNEIIKIEDAIKANEVKNLEIFAEKQTYVSTKETFIKAKDKLKRQNEKITKLKNNQIDINVERKKFEDLSKKVIEDLVETQWKKVTLYGKYSTHLSSYEIGREKLNVFNRNNIEIENQISDHKRSVEQSQKMVDKINEILNQSKSKCKDKQRAACQLSDGKKPNDFDFPYRREFSNLPNDIEEIEQKIGELQGQLDCMDGYDQSILGEYEDRVNQFQQLRLTIDEADKKREDLENKMNDTHDTWFTEINRVITTINENFTKFMLSMGYVGEVSLIRNNERDYDEYGIGIMVKYRSNEKLQALDRFVQSGGERAVAIAIFTLSLQHISHVPFRCVDEINQGMDPRNERKIFNMLINQTAQHGKPQYFFVTPKLLPGLTYNDLMSVSIINNSKAIHESNIFDTTKNL